MAVAVVDVQVRSSDAVKELQRVNQESKKLETAVNGATSAVTRQGREIKTAANGMRYFTDATGRARAENGRFLSTAERAAAGIERQNKAAKLASTGIGALGKAAAGVAATFSAIEAARFVFAKTAELETQNRSIQTLTGSLNTAKQIISELQAIGAVTPFTSTELIETAKRLTAFGVSAKDVVETTRRLGDVAGATGANLGELSLAYGQVIAKGRLQGEELLQFQERGVALQDELRKMYGLTGEEFSKALSKGQISAEAVEVAIVRLTEKGGKYANGAIAQSDTLAGRLSTLQDNVETLAREVGKLLTPALQNILESANTALSQMPKFVEDVGLAFAYASGKLDPLIKGLKNLQWFAVNFTPPGWMMQIVSGTRQRIGGLISEAASAQRQIQQSQFIGPPAPQMYGPGLPSKGKPASTKPPALLDPTGEGRGGSKGKSDAEKAADEAKKLADELKRSLETGDQLGREFSRQTILLASINEQERERFKIQFEYEDRARQIGELKNAEQRVNLAALNDEIRRLDLQRLTTEELKAQNDLFLKRAGLVAQVYGGGAGAFRTDIDLLGQQDKALQSVLDKYPQIGEAASAASQLATQGTMEMINGTKNAQQVFADFLNSIVDILMKSAAQMIAQYIAIGVARMFAGVPSSAAAGGAKYGASAFSGAGMGSTGFSLPFLGARAKGGSVMSGGAYLVGERGPELFMPGRSGGIAPTGSFGGGANIVVNVDASGSSVQGDSSQGKQLGSVIAAAVQAELVKQQRPGGLLAR